MDLILPLRSLSNGQSKILIRLDSFYFERLKRLKKISRRMICTMIKIIKQIKWVFVSRKHTFPAARMVIVMDEYARHFQTSSSTDQPHWHCLAAQEEHFTVSFRSNGINGVYLFMPHLCNFLAAGLFIDLILFNMHFNFSRQLRSTKSLGTRQKVKETSSFWKGWILFGHWLSTDGIFPVLCRWLLIIGNPSGQKFIIN